MPSSREVLDAVPGGRMAVRTCDDGMLDDAAGSRAWRLDPSELAAAAALCVQDLRELGRLMGAGAPCSAWIGGEDGVLYVLAEPDGVIHAAVGAPGSEPLGALARLETALEGENA